MRSAPHRAVAGWYLARPSLISMSAGPAVRLKSSEGDHFSFVSKLAPGVFAATERKVWECLTP